jgi:predicted nucleic acid-binding protein
MGKCLIDSNTVIYFLDGSLPMSAELMIESKIDNNEIAISDITKMEILGFNFPTVDEEAAFINFVAAIETMPITANIIN